MRLDDFKITLKVNDDAIGRNRYIKTILLNWRLQTLDIFLKLSGSISKSLSVIPKIQLTSTMPYINLTEYDNGNAKPRPLIRKLYKQTMITS